MPTIEEILQKIEQDRIMQDIIAQQQAQQQMMELYGYKMTQGQQQPKQQSGPSMPNMNMLDQLSSGKGGSGTAEAVASSAGNSLGADTTAGMMNGTGGGGEGLLAGMGWLAWPAAFAAVREGIGERGLGWVKGGVDDDITRNMKSIDKSTRSWDDFTAGNLAGFGGGGLSKVQSVVSDEIKNLRKNDWMWLVDPFGQAMSKLWK